MTLSGASHWPQIPDHVLFHLPLLQEHVIQVYDPSISRWFLETQKVSPSLGVWGAGLCLCWGLKATLPLGGAQLAPQSHRLIPEWGLPAPSLARPILPH